MGIKLYSESMPTRADVFINGGVYHIFNKTIDGRRIFINNRNCNTFIEMLRYYRSSKSIISYSKLKSLSSPFSDTIKSTILNETFFDIEILSYCLMPTHFHLLIKQQKGHGILRSISNVVNGFTKYFNIKNGRKGPLFLPRFKSRTIITDEQLMHVSRYIHLNPYSSRIVNSIEDLMIYKWSSLKEYIFDYSDICNTNDILDLFYFKKKLYKKFVQNNAVYQRTLEEIKYTEKW